MQRVRLSDICTLRQWGPLSKAQLCPGPYPVYGAHGLIGYHSHCNHTQPVIAIGSRGKSCGNVLLTEGPAYITANALCLEELHADVDPTYLYFYLKHRDLSSLVTGAAQPQLTIKSLCLLELSLPAVPQQKHRASVLRLAESVCRQRRQQLQAIQQTQRALVAEFMQQLQAQPSCNKVRMGEVVHIRCGKKDAHAATEHGAYPFFTCAAQPKRIDSYSFDGECVLLSGNIDFQVNYYHGKFDAYQRIYVLQAKDNTRLHLPYLHAYLQQAGTGLRHMAGGGVIAYLRRSDLEQLPILLPPMQQQLTLCTKLRQCRQTEQQIQQATEEAELLLKSLMQRYFTTPHHGSF